MGTARRNGARGGWAAAAVVSAVGTVVSVGLLALGLAAPPAALAAGSGPPLDVPPAVLASSLSCSADLTRVARDPVLLIPGTTLTPEVNFGWNYEPAFQRLGWPYCALTPPDHAMSDIQVSAEYVVSALRTMHRVAGRPVDVVGFSEGGMISRWALKFWPDTRSDVADVVGIDPSNHGTLDAYPGCAAGCAPAVWQQRTGSRFLAALNAGQETYAGIDYTQIYSLDDEIVVPNLPPAASSALTTGAGRISNVAVQQVCPLHVAGHLAMGSIDPVGYALVLDAITHDGPADPARVDPAVCAELLMPGVDPATLPGNEQRYNGESAQTLLTYPRVGAEPPLKPYAVAPHTPAARSPRAQPTPPGPPVP